MKPIIGAQGEYVTEAKEYTEVWAYYKHGLEAISYSRIGDADILLAGELFATREAAEMALIRAKCIRRLKEMAYKDGWLPNYSKRGSNYGIPIMFHLGHVGPPAPHLHGFFIPGVVFPSYAASKLACETITPEEREAFLYVYKPEEKTDEQTK